MDEVVTTQEEYDTQFFGFLPGAFTDGLFNAFFDYTKDLKNVLQQYLCKEYGETLMTPGQIEAATESLFATLERPTEKAFDRLEMYLTTNTLHVPRHVLLPEDGVHDSPLVVGSDLDDEMTHLEKKIVLEMQRRAELEAEIQGHKDMSLHLKKVLELYTLLDQLQGDSTVHSLKESLESCFNKMNQLLERVERTD